MSDTAYVVCAATEIGHARGRSFHLLRIAADGSHRPWPIVVLRWGRRMFGYVNACPHHGERLDWERDQFFDPTGTRLICGKHGALFELDTGLCIDGPCRGLRLEPVMLTVLDGDVCVSGVRLVTEEDDTRV